MIHPGPCQIEVLKYDLRSTGWLQVGKMNSQVQILLDSVEPVRHKRAEGEPAPAPPSFDESYTPPAHYVKLLEYMHPHERDRHIHFLEGPHLYIVDNRPMEISVTGIVGAHTKPFDADKIISGMMAGRSQAWPRIKYAFGVEEVQDQDPNGKILVVNKETGNTLWAGFAPAGAERQWFVNKARAKDRSLTINDVSFFKFDRAMTADEIKMEWKRNATEKANMGTEAHLGMELWSCSEPTRTTPELLNGLTFVRDFLLPLGVRCFRCEWELFADFEAFAGSADWIGIFPDGELFIVDWKRTANHDVWNAYGKMMEEPLQHLDDTDVCKFCLQLNTYKFCLEKYYGFTVKAMALASIHPEHPFHMFVPSMDREIGYLMAKRRQRVELQNRVALQSRMGQDAPPIPMCALSDTIAWDPVRLPDGKIADSKYAAWLQPDLKTTPDTEQRNALKCWEQLVEAPPLPEEEALAFCSNWHDLVPQCGYTEYAECRSLTGSSSA